MAAATDLRCEGTRRVDAPQLVLGPMLRYVDETSATVWVETDIACEVVVLGRRASTFAVAGHHYALVVIEGLESGRSYEYGVELDGRPRWPDPQLASPASVIRTLDGDRRLRLSFGSCRKAAPHEPPHTDRDGIDAVWALAQTMRQQSPQEWPHLLLFLGDQVYADRVPAATQAFIESRRGAAGPPHREVADFEEYAHLYRESWGEPTIRWLLSTVPTAMVFDDHDVHDDWMTSASWYAEMRAKPWWQERIVGAFMSYWLYQHLGNLGPTELRENELYEQVRRVDDGEVLLREFAARADDRTSGSRWSYCRNLGRSRLVVIDSRAGRDFAGGRREMLDAEEWRWVEKQARGDVEHLLLATSLPLLLPPAIQDLEAWNAAVCVGAWGRTAAWFGERIRRLFDLEHWAAFPSSARRLCALIEEISVGAGAPTPASIVVLSGDVHYAYLSELQPASGERGTSAVYQAVCSPLRNALPRALRFATKLALSRPVEALARRLARWAGAERVAANWRVDEGPWFDNQLATLELGHNHASLRLERAVEPSSTSGALTSLLERELLSSSATHGENADRR